MRFSLLNPSVLATQQRSPWYFAITLVLSVFFAETLVMIVLAHLPEIPMIMEALLDATALSILITPAAYFFIYCPFARHIEEQTHVETELRRSQAQSIQRLQELTQAIAIIQTEKMSGLSQMVAGLAHELNNPVTFIHGNLVFVRQYTQTLLDVIERYQQHQQRYGDAEVEIQTIEQKSELEFVAKDLKKTKPIGEGTGLGLAISYQIVVNNHGGSLKCISEAGKGAEFWIEIPVG